MKKFISIAIISAILAFSSLNVFANTDISVFVDGKYVEYDEKPISQDGTTLVPLRQTFEALGATVDWNSNTQTITADKLDTTIVLSIGSNIAYKNGESFNVLLPPTIINGRTYVPLRFVAESFDADVDWDSASKSVIIKNSSNSSFQKLVNIQNNKLIYNGKEYQIIEVPGGDISGSRKPNVAVDIGFGDRVYWGLTNEYSQLVYVIASEITLQDATKEEVKSNGRYYNDEAKVAGTEDANLDEGHVIADSLGGVSNAYNITPQNSQLNRHGDQAYMEKVIRDANGCKEFIATITYPNTTTQIPSRYHYEYILKGNKIIDDFENISPDSVVIDNAPVETEIITNEDELAKLRQIDTNGNGIVTIAEAKKAGYTMPIYKSDWLYKYMIDSDGDGVVGEGRAQ